MAMRLSDHNVPVMNRTKGDIASGEYVISHPRKPFLKMIDQSEKRDPPHHPSEAPRARLPDGFFSDFKGSGSFSRAATIWHTV